MDNSKGTPITQVLQADDFTDLFSFNKYRLEVIEGPDKGRAITVEKRAVTLGSAHDCDFSFEDSTVSRNHCRIIYDGSGYLLEDLDSRNGTYIESFKIKHAFLRPGARIGIGSTTLQFDLEGEQVNVYLSKGDRFGEMYGQSIEMKEVFGILQRVAPTEATVLVTGESGTGKDLAARAIHTHSRRASNPFIVFDCSSVPRELIESELFGHVKGAFTGAHQDRPGAFVSAHGGTLFLDELGELPLELQPKLLRVLENREVKPLGSNKTINVDTRIIAATNRPLEQMVQEGTFRQDLYYRLAVIYAHLPPLRARRDDIPFLVNMMLEKQGQNYIISHDTMDALKNYEWPGNVRELRNYVERAMILSQGNEINADLLGASTHGPLNVKSDTSPEMAAVDFSVPFKLAKEQLIERFERKYLSTVLESGDWNVTQVAQQIGIHRKSLEYLMKKHNLRRPS